METARKARQRNKLAPLARLIQRSGYRLAKLGPELVELAATEVKEELAASVERAVTGAMLL